MKSKCMSIIFITFCNKSETDLLITRQPNFGLMSKWSISKQHFNPFPHNDTFWRPWETSHLKTLWEKEKLPVTSNFSFSHSVLYLFW